MSDSVGRTSAPTPDTADPVPGRSDGEATAGKPVAPVRAPATTHKGVRVPGGSALMPVPTVDSATTAGGDNKPAVMDRAPVRRDAA